MAQADDRVKAKWRNSGLRTGSRAELMESAKIAVEAMKKMPAIPTKDGAFEVGELGRQQDVARLREQRSAPVAAPVASSAPGTFVYGDGNLCEAGDVIMRGNDLAEVVLIAGNGIVLEVPAQGRSVVQGSDLLAYRRVGQRKK